MARNQYFHQVPRWFWCRRFRNDAGKPRDKWLPWTAHRGNRGLQIRGEDCQIPNPSLLRRDSNTVKRAHRVGRSPWCTSAVISGASAQLAGAWTVSYSWAARSPWPWVSLLHSHSTLSGGWGYLPRLFTASHCQRDFNVNETQLFQKQSAQRTWYTTCSMCWALCSQLLLSSLQFCSRDNTLPLRCGVCVCK